MNKVILVIRILLDIRVVLILHYINRMGPRLWSHAEVMQGICLYVHGCMIGACFVVCVSSFPPYLPMHTTPPDS